MSPKRQWIRPAPGVLVRDPVSKRLLPEGGKEMPLTIYWLRRIKDGTVLLGKPKPAPNKSAGKKKGGDS